MEPIPLPSHVHYELLLQLLEKQTSSAISLYPALQAQVHEVIITLRKALVQQKHLEETCERMHLPVEFHWSLNQTSEGGPS